MLDVMYYIGQNNVRGECVARRRADAIKRDVIKIVRFEVSWFQYAKWAEVSEERAQRYLGGE
jgi:hypothetical protein